MAKILPWSPSGLDTFVNCPSQYQHRYILKDVEVERSEQQLWGEYVHDAFQKRQISGTKLPVELKDHEPYMALLASKPGKHFCEQKIGFSRPPEIGPCGWEDKERIWARMVLDYLKVDLDDHIATLVDYKTGKPHNKFKQLIAYGLHTFMEYPEINLINAQFYWTMTGTMSKRVWGRQDIEPMWAELIPDLQQYRLAFRTDTWQKRQSGLCNGWCPVKDCDFWRPRRK